VYLILLITLHLLIEEEMKYDFTIIIPVFNESGNLERVENECKLFLSSCLLRSSILFVNDGSTDNSQALIESICKRNDHFHFIEFEKNFGLSAAIKAGIDHVDAALTGYMDADLQTSPEDFHILLKELGDHAMVTGVRTRRNDSFVKNASSLIANKIRRFFTRDGMEDTGCPLKIIRTNFARRVPMFNGLHRFLPAMILLQKGTVRQVSVRHFPRIAGKSNFGLANRLVGPLMDCFAYLWMKKKYINYSVKKSRVT
jgi:dolichol-phosphate mannosyltransferase